MELSMGHGTAGDRGIRGECPLKACPVQKYGSVWENGRVGVGRGPQACAADGETGIPEEQRRLSQEPMFFRKPASLDVGNSHCDSELLHSKGCLTPHGVCELKFIQDDAVAIPPGSHPVRGV